MYYNRTRTGDLWTTGIGVFETLSGTYVSSDVGMASIASSISGNLNPGEYFQYIVDLDRPGSEMTIDEYLGMFLTSDVVLSAHYGSNPVYSVYFYGTVADLQTNNLQQVLRVFPVQPGDNIYTAQQDADSFVQQSPGKYILSDHELLGWAYNAPDGPLCHLDMKSDWTLSAVDPVRGDYGFYAITDRRDDELSILVDLSGKVDMIEQAPVIGNDVYGTYVALDFSDDPDADPELSSHIVCLRLAEGEDVTPGGADAANDIDEIGEFTAVKLDTLVHY